MQILEIILYGHEKGQRRVLSFKPGKVNIITGGSQTGKTDIINIINYCLGSESCNVSAGVVRAKVLWLSLRLRVRTTEYFLARKVPSKSGKTSNACVLLSGHVVEIPEQITGLNTTIDYAIAVLNDQIGISGYIHTPPNGQTRDHLAPTLRHALGYCLQKQTEIANNDVLFHNHSDHWVKQAAKDSIPFFLGVFPENYTILKNRLKKLKRDLSTVQTEIKNSNLVASHSRKQGENFLREAKHLGMYSGSFPDNLDDTLNALRTIVDFDSEPLSEPDFSPLEDLSKEINNLVEEVSDISEKIEAANHHLSHLTGFKSSSATHVVRLQSAELFNQETDDDTCPLCESLIEAKIPSIENLKKQALKITKNLEEVEKSKPELVEYIEALKTKESEKKDIISYKRREARNFIAKNNRIKSIKQTYIEYGSLQGKCALWLESLNSANDKSSLKAQESELLEKITELESKIGDTDLQDRLAYIQSKISAKATEYTSLLAKGVLELGYSKNPIRLDLNKLTIISDSIDKPILLKEMGSAENWLCYHMIAIFSLHHFFVTNNRPTPRFVVLDQPSQVYFPKEAANRLKGDISQDLEREKVKEVYKFIFDQTNRLNGELQVIIMDHASVLEDWFQKAIVENWWDKNALVPKSW